MSNLSIRFLISVTIMLAIGCRHGVDSDKLAEIDGIVITRAEVDRSGGKALSNMRRQLYELERQKLDEYIGALLLSREAKARNTSVSTLLEQEVNAKIPAITEEEIRAFYETNRQRIPVDFEKVRDQISEYLQEQKINAQKSEYFKTLYNKAKITTYLEPPPVLRVEVTTNGAPAKGAEKAEVTIVKFEDFECPFCKKVQPTLVELLKKYNGKVRIIHKDLPLQAIHPQAQLAAEAARCAGEQGKFWEYHDALYAKGPKLADADLKAYAKEMNLDSGKFDQCLTTGKYKAAVQKDLAEGAKLGLTGTPAFFINGREISGALPLESFAAIIDEELAQAK
jgi:protein-disulfide isomerase